MSFLRELGLYYAEIDSEGLKVLADGICNHEYLVAVSILHNPISKRRMSCFLKRFESNSVLKSLTLDSDFKLNVEQESIVKAINVERSKSNKEQLIIYHELKEIKMKSQELNKSIHLLLPEPRPEFVDTIGQFLHAKKKLM